MEVATKDKIVYKDKEFIFDIVKYILANNQNKDTLALIDRYMESQKQVERGSIYQSLSYMRSRNVKVMELKPLNLQNSNLKDLISCYQYPDEELFLKDSYKEMYNKLILEVNNKDVFKEHNLPTTNKILLHGVTGNGKTSFARKIAKDLNLPFYEVNCSKLINSKLGKSAENIHDILTQLKEPCVLFVDEIDTITIKRGTSNDTKEYDRTQNSFLINIEKLNENVLFIGATNRFIEMDSAAIRRFDLIHEMEEPSLINKNDYLETLISDKNIYISEDDKKDICFSCKSLSDVKNSAIKIMKNKVFEIIKNK